MPLRDDETCAKIPRWLWHPEGHATEAVFKSIRETLRPGSGPVPQLKRRHSLDTKLYDVEQAIDFVSSLGWASSR